MLADGRAGTLCEKNSTVDCSSCIDGFALSSTAAVGLQTCVGCPKVDGGSCDTCSDPDVCTNVTCHLNLFNVNDKAEDGCEAGCAPVAGGSCAACSSALAGGCIEVQCYEDTLDSNRDASDGCEENIDAVGGYGDNSDSVLDGDSDDKHSAAGGEENDADVLSGVTNGVGGADGQSNDSTLLIGILCGISICCCCFGLLCWQRRNQGKEIERSVLAQDQNFTDTIVLNNMNPIAPNNVNVGIAVQVQEKEKKPRFSKFRKKKGRMRKKMETKHQKLKSQSGINKVKKQFGQQFLSNPLNADIDADIDADNESAKFEMIQFRDGNPMYEKEEKNKESNPVQLKKKASFRAHQDEVGRTYYHDESTNETTWTKPHDTLIKEATHHSHKDPTSRRQYYVNKKSGRTTWSDHDGRVTDLSEQVKTTGSDNIAMVKEIFNQVKETDRTSTNSNPLYNSSMAIELNRKVTEKDKKKSGGAIYVNVEKKKNTRLQKKTASFRMHHDEAGRSYYHDESTDKTTWSKPHETLLKETTHHSHMDPTSRRQYYVNKKTGRTTWSDHDLSEQVKKVD